MRTITLAAAVAACAIVSAAPASAETSSPYGYLQELNYRGLVIYDTATALNTGYVVCSQIDSIPGWTGRDSMDWLYRSTPYGFTYADAVAMVAAAVDQLCPQFLPGGSQNPINDRGMVA